MATGFENAVLAAKRVFVSVGGYGLAAVILAACMLFLDPQLRVPAANWMTLVAMLLLAAPTIRLNEQGRRIWRIRGLISQLELQETELAGKQTGSPEAGDLAASITQSRERLRLAEKGLVDEKGGWTPMIHRVLYGGYALLFASALTRLL